MSDGSQRSETEYGDYVRLKMYVHCLILLHLTLSYLLLDCF
jgi:hypothetical protein